MDKVQDIIYIRRNGGKVMLADGHQYYQLKLYKCGSVIWRCKSYHTKMKCFGSVTLKDNKILKKKPHVCEADFARNEIAVSLSNLKQKVTENDKPIPKLFKKAMKKLEDEGINLISNIPSFSSVQHSLYDMRNKSANVTKVVYGRVEEVQVPAQFYDIILADYYYETVSKLGKIRRVRILLFCTPDARQEIGDVTEFFGDATFKSCPPPFAQLYTIHGDLGSSTESTKSKPFIFALLSDKMQSTYEVMFQLILSQLPQFRPKLYHCDFEVAAINALLLFCPEVQIVGCYYHWHKCMRGKAESLGKSKYKAEKRIVSLCSVLPLLPKEMLLEGWQYIVNESEHLSMQSFIKYIERTWIKEKYINLLSVFGMRHRTNNVIEGYHSKLNKVINKNDKTMMRLLNAIFRHSFTTPTKRNNVRRKVDLVLCAVW